jgi:hypothetical protein
VRSLGRIRILFSLVLLGFGSFFNGCSKASFYPALGATGGAAVGSLGGPGTAAGGAALGWGVGEVSKYMEENKHLTSQVKALSEGDVQQLVKNQLDESMDEGFFDGMLTSYRSYIRGTFTRRQRMEFQVKRLLRIYRGLKTREKALVLTIGVFIGLIVIGNIFNNL